MSEQSPLLLLSFRFSGSGHIRSQSSGKVGAESWSMHISPGKNGKAGGRGYTSRVPVLGTKKSRHSPYLFSHIQCCDTLCSGKVGGEEVHLKRDSICYIYKRHMWHRILVRWFSVFLWRHDTNSAVLQKWILISQTQTHKNIPVTKLCL